MTKNSLVLPFALYSSATHHEITNVLYDQCLYLGFDNGMIVQNLQLLLISHVAPISAFHVTNLPDFSSHRHQRVLLSGCHDGQLLLWANDGNLLRKATIFPNQIIKTITTTDDHIIVGGYTHDIIVLDYSLKIIHKLPISDWSLKCLMNNNALIHISFHGTISIYSSNYSQLQQYPQSREIANHISFLNPNVAVLVGQQYLTLLQISSSNDIQFTTNYKCPDNQVFYYAQFHNNQIIAWSNISLFLFTNELQLITIHSIPPIFGGYIMNNHFYGIFKEKMAIFKLDFVALANDPEHVPDTNNNITKIPLWHFTSDLFTCLEFAPPNRVIFGTNSGHVKITNIYNLFTNNPPTTSFEAHKNSRISCMLIINQLLLTGGEDGKINFWSLTNNQLLSSVACLGGELQQFLLVSNDFTDLTNCVIALSDDNSLSIIDYKLFQCKYAFSGMLYPIIEVGWRSRESLLLITCRDMSTYCWSLQTSHLDRILNDHSREVLDHCDAHFKVSWRKDLMNLDTTRITAVPISASSDIKLLAHVLVINTKRIVHDVHMAVANPNITTKKTHHKKQESLSVSLTHWDTKLVVDVQLELDILRGILSALLPWGLSVEFDAFCHDLGLLAPTNKLTIGITGMDNALSLLLPSNENDNTTQSWCISGFLTSATLLAIGSTLKSLEFATRMPHIFNKSMSLILTLLPDFIGQMYFPPSLDFLLRFYNDSDDEIKQSSRFIFTKCISLMTDDQKQSKLKEKTDLISCLINEPTSPITKSTARSLFLLGIMTSEFDMAPGPLTSLILQLLKQADPLQYSGRVAICDLFTTNYEYWIKYINKEDILDHLFYMLPITQSKEEEIMANSAQKALLYICFVDPQMFIKRLQHNLFIMKLVKEKSSILKLLLTTISKDALFMKPLVPDVAYLVIKLLDPGHPHLREGLNEIIKNLLLAMVSRYPSVSFNASSNKLCVGLENGKIIVYDVSSGTKAYVLQVSETLI